MVPKNEVYIAVPQIMANLLQGNDDMKPLE